MKQGFWHGFQGNNGGFRRSLKVGIFIVRLHLRCLGVPVIKHGENGHLRQKGKIAELALGYGGSVGALTSMGALEMGMEEEELQPLVNQWRSSNPHITNFGGMWILRR